MSHPLVREHSKRFLEHVGLLRVLERLKPGFDYDSQVLSNYFSQSSITEAPPPFLCP